MIHYLHIDTERSGQRLDNYLLALNRKIPKSHIYKLIRSGQVRVNKKRVKPYYKLQAADEIRLPDLFEQKSASLSSNQAAAKQSFGSILYEDKALLIIDKLAHVAVHGGSGISYGVIEILRARYAHLPTLELAHRLDRDTSGCLIICKRRSTLRQLHQLLHQGEMDKTYMALVWGHWPYEGERLLSYPLKKFTSTDGQRWVKVAGDGKPSQTRVECLARYAEHSLLKIKPIEGRTHQIRVHLAHAGYPIVGDLKYGNVLKDEQCSKLYAIKRMYLHAQKLAFLLKGESIAVEAPLDIKFKQTIKLAQASSLS